MDATIARPNCKTENCSAIMEGHSHTEGGTEAPPTVANLTTLIAGNKAIIAKARIDKK
ncbi:hypothetical protein NKH72_30205 [Mesorhizobium sp. M0955]|uniref:hypothetical protein n=1 Tax=Mesorhizobium sp. M0955 TaxID=2957033 RepID=UPI00333A7438